MKKIELNQIPEKLQNGSMTKKQAIDFISSYIYLNYPIFGLERYDEDFREDILLYVIEKGAVILEHYDKTQGEFFTFLYCYILSLTHTKLRAIVQRNIKDTLTIKESINTLSEKEYSYNNINYNLFDYNKVPYAHKKIDPENFKKTFQNLKGDKKFFVIAIKSAYYLTDFQIEKLCNYYKINETEFYSTIQYCKNLLLKKSDKKMKLLERRNYAYYHKKKYDLRLQIIKSELNQNEDILLKNKFIEKEYKHKKNWIRLNKDLDKGILMLRPTNKTIAKILGICERQVAYYIDIAKKKFANYGDKLKVNE